VKKYSEFINFPIYIWSSHDVTREVEVEEGEDDEHDHHDEHTDDLEISDDHDHHEKET